jgi:hypothetical protein
MFQKIENKTRDTGNHSVKKVMGRHFPDYLLLVCEILFVEDEMVGGLGWPATHLDHYCSKDV